MFIDRRLKLPITAASTFAVASLLIFVLPLYVPVSYRPMVSASYVAGFNNRAATLAAAGFSVLVFLVTLWVHRRKASPAGMEAEDQRLSSWFTAAVTIVAGAVLGVCGALVEASNLDYLGDSGYFIQQATVRQDTGRALYTQLEFAYGPLLLFPEIWLSRVLHCSMTTAYFITLVVGESLGLLLLAYVLNEVPMRRSLRKAALVLFAFGAITPLLGLNYTFLRFATPLAVLLFATRSRSPWRCALLLTTGELLVLLLSPELGLALAVGIVVFTAVRAWQQGARWLVAGALPILALAMLLFTLGRPYLAMIATFSGGAINLPVAPYPHLLVLVFALAWVVPVGLGMKMNLRDPKSARLLGLYALSLSLLPAAMGRCDPLHVFFNGVGVLILSLAGVSRGTHRVRNAWLCCFLALVLWEHFVNDRLYDYRTGSVLGRTVLPHLPPSVQAKLLHVLARKSPAFAKNFEAASAPEYKLDVKTLEAIVGNETVATPIEVAPSMREALRVTHHDRPGYYGYWVDVMNAGSEQRSIAELNTASWVILPAEWEGPTMETPDTARGVQGFVFPYPQRHPLPYFLGDAFRKNVMTNWTPVHRFGEYILFHNNNEAYAQAGIEQTGDGN